MNGLRIEALIDYISTSPENINYNMVREILNAILSEEMHPYFNYYFDKIGYDPSNNNPGGEPATK